MSNNKTIIFKNFQNESDKIKRDVRTAKAESSVQSVLSEIREIKDLVKDIRGK